MFASGHAAATGSSLLFFAAMILEILLGLAVLSYAAHSFLTIIVDTAAGSDHVLWPAEPFTDWLWKPWYVAWVAFVWLAPLAVLLAFVKLKPLQTALLFGLVFWLLFPVGLLSSLSATTRWVVFRPILVWYMLRHLGATAAFFVATELLLAVLGVTVYVTQWHPDLMLLLPGTALVAAAVLFLYGRLLGRLAWVMNQRKLGRLEEVEEIAAEAQVEDPWAASSRPGAEAVPCAAKAPARDAPRSKSAPVEVEDPWAVPPSEENSDYWQKGLPLEVQQAGGYGILTDEARSASEPAKPRKKDRPLAVYAAEPASPAQPRLEPVVPAVSKKEQKLLEREPEAPPLAWPMVNGVWSFLGYPATLGPLLTVALGLWLMGVVLREMLKFFGQ